MNQVIHREAATIGLHVRQRRNRELLAELLAGYHLVDIDGPVPGPADLCIVDEGGFEGSRAAIEAWKEEQSPTFAPVLLLASAESGDPWTTYADLLGDALDAILEVPAPRRAILSRAESLLETRRYAVELTRERRLAERVFDTDPIAKMLIDADGTIERVNEEAESLIGIPSQQLVGRSYRDDLLQVFDEDGQRLATADRPFGQVMRTGEPVYARELGFDRPDGKQLWLSVNLAPILDPAGAIEHVVATMVDVTEQRRLQRELEASEELHRTTLEDITDTVVITDERGRFTYVCPNTQHIFDRTTAEVKALGDIESLLGTDPAPDDLEAVGLVENQELRVTDAEGDEHTVLVTVKAVDIQHGSRLYTVRDITRRAETEQALQATVQSRSLALEAANAGVWEFDLVTGELDWDDSLEALDLDDGADIRTLEDLYDGLVHPEDVAALESAVTATVEDDEPFAVTIRLRDGDGGSRWIESHGQAVTDEAGHPIRVVGIAMDVTDRMARERELERYERIVETAPDPIYALDADGVITLANEAFGDIFGVDPEAVIGSPIQMLLEPTQVERSLEHIEGLRSGEDEPEPLEVTIETPAGPREYEVNIALHGGSPDERQGTVGVAHDVTERRERERLLRRAQRAIEASGHAIYITDTEGQILYANQAFERVTGYTQSETLGRTPSILRSEVMPDEHFAALWETISAGRIWDEEVVNERKGGERYHADQTIAPILDEDGEIEGYVAIQTDVSEHKDRLQQLQVMDRVLRHNLHNALNVVLGHADLIREATSGQPAADAETIIRKGNELLDLADKQRAITTSLSVEPVVEDVDLAELVELIAADLRAAHPVAEIRLDLGEDLIAHTTADLEKAIRELVSNAIEHADAAEPVVEVSVERVADRIEVQVADQGPGIPQVERRIITGEQTIDPLFHGSGLGLWLVASIVRRSGGSLEFADNEPRGTVVTVRLPAADG